MTWTEAAFDTNAAAASIPINEDPIITTFDDYGKKNKIFFLSFVFCLLLKQILQLHLNVQVFLIDTHSTNKKTKQKLIFILNLTKKIKPTFNLNPSIGNERGVPPVANTA